MLRPKATLRRKARDGFSFSRAIQLLFFHHTQSGALVGSVNWRVCELTTTNSEPPTLAIKPLEGMQRVIAVTYVCAHGKAPLIHIRPFGRYISNRFSSGVNRIPADVSVVRESLRGPRGYVASRTE